MNLRKDPIACYPYVLEGIPLGLWQVDVLRPCGNLGGVPAVFVEVLVYGNYEDECTSPTWVILYAQGA